MIYNTAPHYFLNDPNTSSSYRISGGSDMLVNQLSETIKSNIKTATIVSEIKENEQGVTVTTNGDTYYAEKVIITIPPRIASNISFSRSLPQATIKVMKQTHTWMSNAIKVGLLLKRHFGKRIIFRKQL